MKKINHIFSIDYRIYYEDTDVGGVVYYSNYLKFFERARTDFLRSKNIIQSSLAGFTKIIFVARKCETEYLLPAKLDDVITVTIEEITTKNSFIFMKQNIFKDRKLITTLKITLVAINNITFKPTKIPSNIHKIFAIN